MTGASVAIFVSIALGNSGFALATGIDGVTVAGEVAATGGATRRDDSGALTGFEATASAASGVSTFKIRRDTFGTSSITSLDDRTGSADESRVGLLDGDPATLVGAATARRLLRESESDSRLEPISRVEVDGVGVFIVGPDNATGARLAAIGCGLLDGKAGGVGSPAI